MLGSWRVVHYGSLLGTEVPVGDTDILGCAAMLPTQQCAVGAQQAKRTTGYITGPPCSATSRSLLHDLMKPLSSAFLDWRTC